MATFTRILYPPPARGPQPISPRSLHAQIARLVDEAGTISAREIARRLGLDTKAALVLLESLTGRLVSRTSPGPTSPDTLYQPLTGTVAPHPPAASTQGTPHALAPAGRAGGRHIDVLV